MKKIFFTIVLFTSIKAVSQDSSQVDKKAEASFQVSGYAEAYYSYDFGKPVDNNKPSFVYSHNRHNEFNINLAFIKAAYSNERVRANIALAAGTYMNANYSAEPGVLKNIFEANAGVKLSARKNLWLDIGILPSHIGFESAIGKDNWTLTRSMVADNSPYFESGARLSYATDNGRWQVSVLALNGWQRITRVSGNSLMSWGSQFTFKPSANLTINYSNFAGTDKPDSIRAWRIYHNLYATWQISEKVGLITGFDIGSEQKSKGSSKYNTWYAPVAILRITPSSEWAFALRGEYFNDKNGVVISGGHFETTGLSATADYFIFKNAVLRAEAKSYSGKNDWFVDSNGKPSGNNHSLSFALAVWF